MNYEFVLLLAALKLSIFLTTSAEETAMHWEAFIHVVQKFLLAVL